jgi:4-hydroxybenzoate polyprenyltransferase
MLPLPLCFGVQMPLVWYIFLPIGAWMVYLLDHVLDVTRKQEEYPTPRHQFIRANLRPVFMIIVFFSLCLLALAVLQYDPVLFVCGGVMAGTVLIHFIMVRINPEHNSLLNNKELAVAVVYAAGIYSGPVAMLIHQAGPPGTPLLFFGLFLLITFLNLLMCSTIEFDHDVRMGNSSVARILGKQTSARLVYAIAGVCSMCALLLLLRTNGYTALLATVYLLMTAGHVAVFRYSQRLETHLVYRKIAEMLFWMPALVWLAGQL